MALVLRPLEILALIYASCAATKSGSGKVGYTPRRASKMHAAGSCGGVARSPLTEAALPPLSAGRAAPLADLDDPSLARGRQC
ncbi:hypothetical protein D3C72_1974540 [compost metagenome]